MSGSAIQKLIEAAQEPSLNAAQLRQQGHETIRVLGPDAPYELLRALGLTPVRMVADLEMKTPLADELIGTETLGQRGRSLLQQILSDQTNTPLLITHADNELPQIFYSLRELLRTGDIESRPILFLDFLHLPKETSQTYNKIRLQQLVQALESLSVQKLTNISWQKAMADHIENLTLLQTAKALRDGQPSLVSGAEFYAMIAAAQILPPEQLAPLLSQAIEECKTQSPSIAKRLITAGAPQFTGKVYQELSDAGYQIVGDIHDYGDSLLHSVGMTNDWIEYLSDPALRQPSKLIPAFERAHQLIKLARKTKADGVLYLVTKGDEPSQWDARIIQGMLFSEGIACGIWCKGDQLADTETLFAEPKTISVDTNSSKQMNQKNSSGNSTSKPKQSKKVLASVADFGSYQRDWFQKVKQQAADGSPFAVVGANAPQETLRAMGIPFVVTQWWASIAAAKQQSKRYFGLLKEHGYPSDVESYSSQGLAAFFDEDASLAPWGGLPKPDFVEAVNSSDATPRIYDHWARETKAELIQFERTIDPRLDISAQWWDSLPDNWDTELEACRIDLLADEMNEAIKRIGKITGQVFDKDAFVNIMHLVNEQENYYLLTRDLIAQTYPAPVSIVDTMPATMVPQWHRGTTWARDAAKRFYEEVKHKAEAGEGVCTNERLRLMWVGRGMWSDMSFYQRWQESHGAVFVWSMYLGLAADGYIRKFDNNRDPLRALAARFITMGDELRMPTWAGAWHVREAETHGVQGVIALSDADPFVLRALKRAGVPVLALTLENFNQSDQDQDDSNRQIKEFLDDLIGY
ncbi:MAG: 2-hydroxyacyl-CoA dehydratase family protein [Gammaproteobacteria bacterium]|nr:2-hydroxyacyl-CoA dehydratase family protein [Gammaproteobacteria bacterium]